MPVVEVLWAIVAVRNETLITGLARGVFG